jgi:glutathione S-transferase
MIVEDDQLRTKEVKKWKGLHLLHFHGSSCSQKVRVLMREKGIKFTSHHVNLARNEHVTHWYLGINPRGVVPVLVHDGVVHVESNDILQYLDYLPSRKPSFFPQTDAESEIVDASLKLEDSLHMELRTLTMGFMLPGSLVKKSKETLERYEKEGAADPSRAREVEWWRDFAENGISKEMAQAAAAAYRDAFDGLEAQLDDGPWLLGDRMSVLDIAWFISANRLALAGYPLSHHPKLFKWYQRLKRRPIFAKETNMGFAITKIAVPLYWLYRNLRGDTLARVAKTA